ncbi:hypothetical protein BJ166DRAFT_615047, partial [Pestalotiopsis sp. NC0098]
LHLLLRKRIDEFSKIRVQLTNRRAHGIPVVLGRDDPERSREPVDGPLEVLHAVEHAPRRAGALEVGPAAQQRGHGARHARRAGRRDVVQDGGRVGAVCGVALGRVQVGRVHEADEGRGRGVDGGRAGRRAIPGVGRAGQVFGARGDVVQVGEGSGGVDGGGGEDREEEMESDGDHVGGFFIKLLVDYGAAYV